MTDTAQFQPETFYQDSDVAKSYDSFRFSSRSGIRGDKKEKRAFTQLLDKAGTIETALDVPCGTGRMTEVLLKRGIRVTGCDISPQMMKQAEIKLSQYSANLDFVEGDLRKLGLKDHSFDLVTCVRLFGHFDASNREEMLKEMARVSRKWVIVQYFVATPLTRFKRIVKNHILHTYPGVGHPTPIGDARSEIESAGLTIQATSFARWYYSEEVFFLLSPK